MNNILITSAKAKYIKSYWNTFDEIASERKYLASTCAFSLEDTIKFIENSIEKNIPYLFVIDKDKDTVIGWCDVQPKDIHIGYLGIGILKDYRKKGIGKNLIGTILEKSKEYGYYFVELDVRYTNERAIQLYKSVGFKIVNIIKEGLEIDGVKEDVLQMTINL